MEIQIKPNTETKYKIKVDFMDVKSILILYLELHTFKSMVMVSLQNKIVLSVCSSFAYIICILTNRLNIFFNFFFKLNFRHGPDNRAGKGAAVALPVAVPEVPLQPGLLSQVI